MTISPELVSDIHPFELLADPVAGFTKLREQSRVVHVPAMNSWWVTGHAEVCDALRRPAEFSSRMLEHITYLDGTNILVDDGDDHRRYRRALVATLKPVAVDRHVSAFVRPIATDAVAALRHRGQADLVADFWEPLAVRCFAEILGAGPDIGTDILRRWYGELAKGAANFLRDPDTAAQARATSDEIDRALLPRLRHLESYPDHSLISHLLAKASGSTLEEKAADILPNVKILIGAGEQEPGHLGSTALAGILSTPAVHDRLRADPDDASAIAEAVEEAARWCPPVQAVSRYTSVDTELGGVPIPAGHWVNLSLQAANHDPAVFDEPQTFRPGRDVQHVAFGTGGGLHTCAGAPFGRAVVATAIRELLAALPELRLDAERPWEFTGFGFRAPGSLFATWAV